MKKIDMEAWDRKSHFEWFSSFADPTFALDVKMDITNLLEYCSDKSLSSYAVIMYVICQCMNENKSFLLRVLGGDVVEIDRANVAYTIMTNESTFVNCRANLKNGFVTYMDDVKNNQKQYHMQNYKQEKYNDLVIVDDIYCSCVPWVNFISAKQQIPDKSDENRSIPRACWGKYYTEGERTYMTLNITANHALVDGRDMSIVFNDIQLAFDNPQKFFSKDFK